MADNIPPPPPGFSIQQSASSVPPPPAGFTVQDSVPPPPSGFTMQGAKPTAQGTPPVGDDFLGKMGHYLHGVYTQAIANSPIMNGVPSPTTIALGMTESGRKLLQANPQLAAATSNTLGVRDVMEAMGIGMDQLKVQHPGQTDAWYQSQLHQGYNRAVDMVRQQGGQEALANRVGQGQQTVQGLITGAKPQQTLGDRAARLTQQALGIGANALANPQYMVIPGMGIGGNVATRIASSAAGNAVIGSASDVAAQTMDIAQGMKKDFDVNQNLQAAATSGLFGAGMHGAIEAAPFVKGLFASRGVDTTPAADPRGSPISPMTTDHVALNAADHMEYQRLLQTGSVDDIKNFFQGRNGPQPSWRDVNDWVEHRDNGPMVNGQPASQDVSMHPDFNYEQEHNNFAEQQWRDQNRQAVQDHVANQMAGWKNAPDVEVIHGPEDIQDPAIREQALREDGNGNALGFLGSDGQVRMYSGRITDPDAANAILYHEGLGHFGLAQKFGDKLDSTLQSLLDRNVNQFSRDTDAWQKANPGAYGGDRLRAAEEVLAERSQNGQLKPGIKDAVSAAVRQFGRKMGLNLSYTDGEVNHILGMAHDAVINGTDASSNGFQGSSRFMRPDQFQPANESEPKFITRSQLASSPDYKAENLEQIYKGLDEGYTPTTVSWEDNRRTAMAAGFSPSQIKDLKVTNPGELSTRLYRMQSAANMADAKISALNEKLETGEWSEKDRADYVETLANLHYLTTRIVGDRAEYARALNVAKAASSYGKATMDEIKELLEQNGSGLSKLIDDPTAFLKFARQAKNLMNSGNTAGAHQMFKAVNSANWEDYLTSAHMNFMLSGLSTHVKAPQDMATGIAREAIERAIAVPIGKIMEPIWGKGVTTDEVAANIYGIVHAVTDAEIYRQSVNAVKTGEGRWVQPNGTVSPTHVNMTGTRNLPRIPVVSIPTDLINGQDTYFRGVSLAQNLYSLGAREARAQLGPKATMDDVGILGKSMAMQPSPEMLKEAQELTNRTLLLNANRFNDAVTGSRSKLGNDFNGRLGKFLIDNLAPFIRVASNSLFTRVIERSPLAFLSKYTRDELAAGGPRAGIAAAKIAYGTALIGMYWMVADKGANWVKTVTGNANKQITGAGPDNPDKYKEQMAAGWKPNSIYEDGRYNTPNLAASVNPFDIHNTTATTVADLKEAWDRGANKGQVGTAFKLALGSLIHELTSTTWINNLEPYGEAITARGNTAQYKVNQTVGDELHSWVPAVMSQTARLMDPTKHDVIDPESISNTALNEIKSAVPGMTDQLPTKYSVYGNPLQNGATLTGTHVISPMLPGNGTRETTDPAERELDRLGGLVTSALVTPVQKTITNEDGSSRKLTTAEFEEYQRLSGRAIVETVRQEMNTPEWQQMSDQDKIIEVKDIQKEMKAAAREALFGK